MLVAVAVYALTVDPALRRSYVIRFVPSGVLSVGVALALVIYGGRGGNDALGGRSGVIGALELAEVPRQVALHIGGVLLTVAVLPVLASLVMIVAGLSHGR